MGATVSGGPSWQRPASGARRCTSRDKMREQEGGPDIDYLFAPLKRARLDYMVQKAVEMGVARLRPVLTRRTVAERVNMDRHARQCHRGCRTVRHPAHP